MQRHMALASGQAQVTTISCMKILRSWPNEAKNSCVLWLLISCRRDVGGGTKRRVGCRISCACSTPPSRPRAKTVLSRMVKALIDPNAAPVRALSREQRELMIAANNSYLLAFNNLSGLPHWLSDALCRLATGGSFAVRQLYTDDEEVLFDASRPILLNGIEDVISRPDLGDRAIFLTLAPIPETDRRPEAELWRQFEIAGPRILGALLDAVVQGLRAVNQVQLAALPRMADFALWAAACETAFWPAGTFAHAYAANRRAAIESIIEIRPARQLRAHDRGRT